MISNERKGYRDIYWCYIINEPMIIQHVGIELYCPVCECKAKDDEELERIGHRFIGHVLKPKDK